MFALATVNHVWYEALQWKTIYNHYIRNGKGLAGEVETTNTTNTTQQTLFECSTTNVKLEFF